jgi:hypothetical protein
MLTDTFGSAKPRRRRKIKRLFKRSNRLRTSFLIQKLIHWKTNPRKKTHPRKLIYQKTQTTKKTNPTTS